MLLCFLLEEVNPFTILHSFALGSSSLIHSFLHHSSIIHHLLIHPSSHPSIHSSFTHLSSLLPPLPPFRPSFFYSHFFCLLTNLCMSGLCHPLSFQPPMPGSQVCSGYSALLGSTPDPRPVLRAFWTFSTLCQDPGGKPRPVVIACS